MLRRDAQGALGKTSHDDPGFSQQSAMHKGAPGVEGLPTNLAGRGSNRLFQRDSLPVLDGQTQQRDAQGS